MANPLSAWEAETFDFLAAQNWNPRGATVLLAVSGGADSIALLHFWARACEPGRTAGPAFGCKPAVAHIHHGLRASSDADQAFVSDLCRELDLPLHIRALDPRDKPARLSTEMWARGERYRFFAEAAREAGADWILTAHQRDDLVETVFQRLGRGTGPRGLAGIPFRREPGIVRPFLNRSRAEILDYLRLCGAAWREDESNRDIRINRNWYRHRYLPSLRKSEPDLDARIFALAMRLQALGKGMDALEEADGLLTRDESGKPVLSLTGVAERVAAGDWESLTYWLRALLRVSLPDRAPRSVTKEILDEFVRQWRQEPKGLQVTVSRDIALKFGNNGIFCLENTLDLRTGAAGEAAVRAFNDGTLNISSPKKPSKKSCSPDTQRVILDGLDSDFSWQWEGRSYKLSARRYARPRGLAFPASGEGRAIFDADRFSCTLVVRSRRAGDCFSPLGVSSRSRKLKAFFNEKKVPVGMRDVLPIILSDETLAWVPGYGISDFLKVTESTTSILELVLTCENL